MQTTVENSMAKGLAGQIADLSTAQIDSYANNSKMLSVVTITTGGAGTVHTVTINGTSYSHTEVFGQSATQIAAALIVLIDAGGEAVTLVDNSDGSFLVRSNTVGTAFTCTTTTGTTVAITTPIANNHTIQFGKMVVQDNETGQDRKCHLPYTSAQVTGRRALGFSVHDHAHEQEIAGTTNTGYPAQSMISVLRKGRILVQVEEAVTPASTPHVRFASGTYADLGSVRASVDGGTAAPLSIARFVDSANALGFATLDINWP